MWKKILSLIILTLLVVHLTGFYVYFVVRLGSIRTTMREQLAQLPDNELELLTIPNNRFRASWAAEREMKWEGHMYDIARIERSVDVMKVYCVRDHDEDGLLNFISAVVDLTQQDTQPAPLSVVKFFTLKFITGPVAAVRNPGPTVAIPAFCCSFSALIPFNIHPPTPPPRG